MNTLIEHWQDIDLSAPPYVHPKDVPFFRCRRKKDLEHTVLDAETFRCDEIANGKRFFHLSLLPAPYIGDLENADIFILMLNPGFQKSEYEIEADRKVKSALTTTLRQGLTDAEYPFWYLDPQYQCHTGHQYWQKNLLRTGDYRMLSRRLAVLQMIPYHSVAFNADILAKELPSAQQARRYVHDVIVPKAKSGKALLIVARQVRNWGFTQKDATDNVIIYSGGENRGAKVSSGSRGGKAIMNWLAMQKPHERIKNGKTNTENEIRPDDRPREMETVYVGDDNVETTSAPCASPGSFRALLGGERANERQDGGSAARQIGLRR